MNVPNLTPDQQAKHDEVMQLVNEYDCADDYCQREVHKQALSTAIAQLCAQIGDGAPTLTDVQWMNICNHDHGYESMDKDEAVAAAVKLTESKLQKNFASLQSERDQLKAENERLLVNIEKWRHASNEWADVAINGLQWIKNIEDGTSQVLAAKENMLIGIQHCKDTVADIKETP